MSNIGRHKTNGKGHLHSEGGISDCVMMPVLGILQDFRRNFTEFLKYSAEFGVLLSKKLPGKVKTYKYTFGDFRPCVFYESFKFNYRPTLKDLSRLQYIVQ